MGVFWYRQENFFLYDGNRVQVVPCDVHDYVFNDFNTSQQSKVWGFVDSTHQEVWWFYPSNGATEVDRYVAYDMMEKHWLVGELSRTAGVARGVLLIRSLQKKQTTDQISWITKSATTTTDSTVYAETGPFNWRRRSDCQGKQRYPRRKNAGRRADDIQNALSSERH